MTRRAGVASALGLCLIAAGCSPSGETPAAGPTVQEAQPTAGTESLVETTQDLAIEFRSEPDPPKAGENAIEVAVKRPDGSPVTDATVTTAFSMPAMPSMNMPPMRSDVALAYVAEGIYRGTGHLSMAGTWNVTVAVSRAGQQIGVKKFSVIAK